MEKYSQFRDKGTAIAPFLPIPTPPTSPLWAPIHVLLFLLRVPCILFLSVFYFLILEILPVGELCKKCVLWVLLVVPGVWWVDLQVDGVKRGKLAETKNNLPQPGTIIASSFISPLDPLYLAGIFCPIFTRCYPYTRKVERISLFRAILLAFAQPQLAPTDPANLITLKELTEQNPKRIICVFPECTTTNGRGILPISEGLLSADSRTRIYPVNLRYTPGDITTPVPGNIFAWFWKLLSKPSHYMRVRIARSMYNNPALDFPRKEMEQKAAAASGVDLDFSEDEDEEDDVFGELKKRDSVKEREDAGVSKEEQKVLDRVGEDLARLGRVKRVGLGVPEKIEFVKVWAKRRR